MPLVSVSALDPREGEERGLVFLPALIYNTKESGKKSEGDVISEGLGLSYETSA